MKSIKEYCICDAVISSKERSKNLYQNIYNVCGKNNKEEYITIIKFNIDTIMEISKIKDNLKKIEICFYLYDLKLDECSEAYMLNLGINLDQVTINTVAYNTAPKFYQECHMYRIKKDFVGQYINFDITHIVDKWVRNKYKNNGLTMLGLNTNGLACFGSSKDKNKAFLKIYYEKDYDNCNIKKIEEKCECKKIINKNVSGMFYNKSGAMFKDYGSYIVIWEKKVGVVGLETDGACNGIIINDIGIYEVDYGVNLRSNTMTIMQLEGNGKVIEQTKIQVGGIEGMNYGHTLVEINENRTLIELKVLGEDIMIVSEGIAASIRIKKVMN